ncbi:MAG: HupE/UreJ family protein [Rhodospirillaceae bacterium]
MLARNLFALVVALATTTAHAHTFGASGFGFEEGGAHPISGIDHIMAMVAVGLWLHNKADKRYWAHSNIARIVARVGSSAIATAGLVLMIS